MIKKFLCLSMFAFALLAFSAQASAQQAEAINTINGEVISLLPIEGESCQAANSVDGGGFGGDAGGDIGFNANEAVSDEVVSAQAQPGTRPRPGRRPRPAGCLQQECWITCNIPGGGNRYEAALNCGGAVQRSLRSSCRLAGGTVTSISCRAMGYCGSPGAPAPYRPTIVPGPQPW